MFLDQSRDLLNELNECIPSSDKELIELRVLNFCNLLSVVWKDCRKVTLCDGVTEIMVKEFYNQDVLFFCKDRTVYITALGPRKQDLKHLLEDDL